MLEFCAGHDRAFRTLVERHQRSLVNLFRRLGADHHGAEDCAQDTFLRLYRCRDRYQATAPFAAFLYTLGRHSWVDWTRRRGRAWQDEQRALEEAAPDPTSGLGDQLDLHEAMANLPEPMRWVLVLSAGHGLSYAEIATILEIPVGTVKSRVFHAVRRLRAVLQLEVKE